MSSCFGYLLRKMKNVPNLIVQTVLCAAAFHVNVVMGADLTSFETTCVELGFTKKTPAFGECVLELHQRFIAKNRQKESEENAIGDGTPDHETCKKYGLLPPSVGYSQCRMQIDQVKQQAQTNQKKYDDQIAAQEREKSRRASEALMMLGLGMMAGPQRAPIQTYTQPAAPANGFHTYTLPNGRNMICNTFGAMTNCN